MASSRKAKRAEPETGAGAPVPADVLGEIVGYALRRAQVAIYQDYMRTIGEHDIRPAQFAALSVIAANPGLSQTTLAATLGIDRSGAVTLIDALERRGLAMRMPSPNDRRTHAIMLTGAGRAMLETLNELVRQHDSRMTAGFTQAEREQLISMLRRLYER